ncbi:Hsp70 family protein [Streptomyces longwoodensis]|uniref:Hsp70 family protein n=1 Tax=Streptomyces longwoodensis TaxID=68231 RepID=UPI0036E7E1F3
MASSPGATRRLAVLELTDLPRHPKGTPLVEVGFDIDANGILHVEAKERQVADSAAAFTGRTCSATVNRSTTVRATALVRSSRWQSLRALVAGVQLPAAEPSGSWKPPQRPPGPPLPGGQAHKSRGPHSRT